MITVTDINHDGQVDCKDYVIQNVFKAVQIGAIPTVHRQGNHVFVIAEKSDGTIYVLDNERIYVTRRR